MQNLNRFIKGIRYFRDKTLYQNDEWTFPSSGIRLTDFEEKGLAINFIRGNVEVVNGQLAGSKFSISSGFKPVGWVEKGGIMYIVSYNDISDEGEIGCYPSPKGAPGNTTGFERTYKPLMNYDTGSGRENLRTTLFGFTLNGTMDVQAKKIYNGSVNLYIADYINPNIVINTGFNDLGLVIGDTITPDSFNGSLNLFPTASKHIHADLHLVESGGSLRPGMYFLYYRYVKIDLTRTKFIGNTGPIQVFQGESWDDIEGSYENTYEGGQMVTDKKISLTFDPVFDEAYAYIEIAVIRYSESSDSAPLIDSYLIDNFYSLEQIKNDPNHILYVDGRESEITLSKEEVFIQPQNYTICKSQAISDSRYFGANWKKIHNNNEALAEFAKLITLSYAVSNPLDDNQPIDTGSLTSGNPYQHKINEIDDNVTYKYTGFFRGETYPFAIKAKMTDGSISEAFPVTGYYDRDLAREHPNDKGIYTFPFFSSTTSNGLEDHHNALGIKFITTAAMDFFNSNPDKFKNVSSIIFLRGERIVNLIHQGIGFRAINGFGWSRSGGGTKEATFQENRVASFLRPFRKDDTFGTFPMTVVGGDYSDSKYFKSSQSPSKYHLYDQNKFGIYSPSYLFKDSDVGSGSSVVVIGFKKFSSSDPMNSGGIVTGPTDRAHLITSLEYDNPDLVNQSWQVLSTPIKINAIAYFNKDGMLNAPEGFQTLAHEGVTSGSDYFLREPVDCDDVPHNGWCPGEDAKYCANLSYASARYIGLKTSDTIYENFDEHLFNIYLNDPTIDLYDSIVNSFNPAVTLYHEISQIFNIENIGNNHDMYKGDCFLQRTYFRAHWAWDPGKQWAEFDDNTDGFKANYGMVVSLLTENTVNTAMRNEVEVQDENINVIYSYYPKINARGRTIRDWAADWKNEESRYEAFKINQGYNKIVSDNTVFGYDKNMPVGSVLKNTRIYFSPKSVPGEKSDSFKEIGYVSFRDYALEDGSIIGLFAMGGTVVSIQTGAINQHFLGEQELQQTDSARIVLQQSGIFLSPKVKRLAGYGSQHKWSMVEGGGAILGVDFDERKIWMVGSIPNSQGQVSFGAKDLSTDTQIQGWLESMCNVFEPDKDIISRLADHPLLGIGIVSGYNKLYKETNFTFHLPIIEITNIITPPQFLKDVEYPKYSVVSDASNNDCMFHAEYDLPAFTVLPPCNTGSAEWGPVNLERSYTLDSSLIIKEGYLVQVYGANGIGRYYISPIDNPKTEFDLQVPGVINYIEFEYTIDRSLSKTITFDTNILAFIGTQPYLPALYLGLEQSMYSVNYDENSNKMANFWKHDNSECPVGTFYGTKFPGQLSFIVVGGDAREVVKMFNSYKIESMDPEFLKIEFQTDYQSSSIDPFINPDKNMFYMQPQYIENMWQGPISLNEVRNALYNTSSEMRGTWLKVTVTYNGDDEQFIRKFITDFIISFS